MDCEQPEEKRMRRVESNYAGLSVPPPLTPFYPPPASLSALKLAASSTPHDLSLLLEADRNRLFHHWMSAGRMDVDLPTWMRTNWPFLPPVPSSDAAAAAHLMTSALHYYPHMIQPGYSLPPQSPIPLPPHPFLTPHPPMYLSPAYGLPLYHRPILGAGHDPSAPGSRADEKIQPPVLSPDRAGSVTPTAVLPPPLPTTLEKEASARLIPASTVDPANKKPLGSLKRSCNAASQVRVKKQRKLPADAVEPEKGTKSKSPCSGGSFLSVETLLRRETRSEITEPEEDDPDASWATRPAFREQPHLPGQMTNNSSISNRNYKNMTRERRMQANARERTRVHTISAAFEALRRAVPSFSHGQRLSKLSILRVASAYIAALGQLADDDQPADDANLSECVDLCTRTLMTEGQMLRRKRSGQPQQPNSGELNGTDDEDDDD